MRSSSEIAERARRVKKVRARMKELINRAKTRPCMDCKIQYNPWVMDFDHRDQSMKRMEVSRCRNSFSQLQKEIEKCDVVCANCHRERTQKQILGRATHKFTKTVSTNAQIDFYA